MYTIAELARLVGLPYMTVANQMKRGWCAWPQRRMLSQTKNSAYKCWEDMVQRCTNSSSTGYENYGGRGIKIDWRWRISFAWFLEDVGPRPSGRHSLDRIDVDGHYTKENVRWATPEQQAANRRPKPESDRVGQYIEKHGRKFRIKRRHRYHTFNTLEEATMWQEVEGNW